MEIMGSWWSFAIAFRLFILTEFNFLFSEWFADILNHFKLIGMAFYLGQLIEVFQTAIYNFFKSQKFIFIFCINSLNSFLYTGHYMMSISLNFSRPDTEPFIRSEFQFGVNWLPIVNQSLKFIELYVLKVFWFVVDDDSFLGI